MGPSNSSYLSNTAILHFHDYGRKSSWFLCMVHPGKQKHFEPKDMEAFGSDYFPFQLGSF